MKEVLLVVAGTGRREKVTIKPETTPRDLLEQLGLQNYALSTDGDPANLIQDDADLYNLVESGGKLWATTRAEVGSRAGNRPLPAGRQ